MAAILARPFRSYTDEALVLNCTASDLDLGSLYLLSSWLSETDTNVPSSGKSSQLQTRFLQQKDQSRPRYI